MATDEDEQRRAWFRREVLPHEASLARYAARLSRTSDDADDLVHETFSRMIAYAAWRDIRHAKAFAVSTLRNLVLQAARQRKIVQITTIAELAALPIGDEAPGADRIAESRDELRYLAQVVEGLPPQCRRVFTLCKIDGLSHRQIAERLGLSISTIEKHMVKALRLCSEALAGCGDPSGESDGTRRDEGTATTHPRGSGDLGRPAVRPGERRRPYRL